MMACLHDPPEDLGILHKLKKRDSLARHHLEEVIRIFDETGMYAFLEQSKMELDEIFYIIRPNPTY